MMLSDIATKLTYELFDVLILFLVDDALRRPPHRRNEPRGAVVS